MAGEVIGQVSTVPTAWAVFSVIGGTLVGSAIGGTISYLLQMKSQKVTKAQRDEDRFELRKALAFSLFVKVSQITSNINTVRKYIAEPIAATVADGEMKMLWRFVLRQQMT